MKFSATVLMFLSAAIAAAAAPVSAPAAVPPTPMQAVTCPVPAPAPDASKPPAWKSDDEYKAFMAFGDPAAAGTPADKVKLAQAFLQKFPDSNYKDTVLDMIQKFQFQARNPAGAVQAADTVMRTPGMDAGKLGNAYLIIVSDLPPTIQASDANFASELATLKMAAQCGAAMEQASNDGNKAAKLYLFNKAAGVVSMDEKNYPATIDAFTKLLHDPATPATDKPLLYYWIGVAQVASTPPNFQDGIYNLAHAINLAPNSPGAPAIKNYLTQVYTGFHGSADGLDQLIAQATADSRPTGMTIKDVNEIAQEKADADYKKAQEDAITAAHESDTLAGWEWRLQQPDRAAAEWKKYLAEYGKGVELPGSVVSSTTETKAGSPIPVVTSVDVSTQNNGVADLHVVLEDPLPITKQPAKGDKVSAAGLPVSYRPSPFLITLEHGIIKPQ